MKDKYDEAIEYLTEHPEEIYETWNSAISNSELPGACLFRACSNDSKKCYGCLIQVRYREYPAQTPELTAAILADKRIPPANEITVEDLPVFAEWQRRLDKELNR